MQRPSSLPFEISRGRRVKVEYGNIEYSAVIHPPPIPCSFIHLGTEGSIVAAQMTCVFPAEIKTEPSA